MRRTLSENARSRISRGIHRHFDQTAGVAQGRKVADRVSGRTLHTR